MSLYSWGQIRLLLQQFAGTGTTLDTIDSAINARYSLILSLLNWKGLEVSATIETIPSYSAGTIAVTPGSTAVVGTGTVWTAAMSGRKMILCSKWYTITVTSATTITLDRPFEDDAATGYWIVVPYYNLPDNCRELKIIANPRSGIALDEMGEVEFARLEGLPIEWGAQAGSKYVLMPDSVDAVTGETVQRIFIYPIESGQYGYPITYDQDAEAFDGTNTSDGPLAFVSDFALLAGCKADLSPDAATSMKWEAQFQAHLSGMIHIENNKTPPEPLRMAPQYVRHRVTRLLRNMGGSFLSRWGGL